MTDPINFRALCVNLLDCLEKADWPPRYRNVFGQWASIARAALAEPADGPAAVAEEWNHASWDDLAELFSRHCCEVGDEGVGIVAKDVPAFARAVLARWGQPPASPAEGEIGYLLLELRAQAELQRVQGYGTGADALTRAAELLERHAAPVLLPAQGGEVQP